MSGEQNTAAGKIEEAGLKRNDWHGILLNETKWQDKPLTFHFKKLRYSGLCALTSSNVKFEILSANSVTFSNDTSEIFLHRRSALSRTYPDSLHTFGGAFVPKDPEGKEYDDNEDLVQTAEENFSRKVIWLLFGIMGGRP